MADDRNWREIDLDILRENLLALKSVVPEGVRLLAVVKADAYGHGAVQVSEMALRTGVSWLAVAAVEEGVALRRAGIEAPILVLGAAAESSAWKGVVQGLTQTVCTPEMVELVGKAARETAVPATVHLKLDTGMGRIGCRSPEEIRAVLEALEAWPEVKLTGVYTHFADADGVAEDYTMAQFKLFREWTAALPPDVLRHCANSAAITRYPEMAMDMVRAGISLYGCPPVETNLNLRPAMNWKAEITHVKTVAAGEAVSYGCTWRAPDVRRIATVACGYGDGYHRAASNRAQVLIHGRRCPVVGRVCMDQLMADVTGLDGVKAGDTATLMGRDGDGFISPDELAGWCGTISYELLLSAPPRVHRRWRRE